MVARGLVHLRTLDDVLGVLRRRDVPALALKGPVLEADLGADPVLRDCADVDLLVKREDLPGALDALGHAGYAPGIDVHPSSWPLYLRLCGEIPLLREGRSTVDLHWALAPGYFRFRPDMEGVWTRARTVEVAGRTVATLSREDTLLHLGAHGALHLWSEARWVRDVARFLDAHPDLDAARLVAEARATGTLRILAVGTGLARETCGAALPPGLRDGEIGDAGSRALVRAFAEALRAGVAGVATPAAPGTVLRTHLRLRERVRDRVAYLAGLAHVPGPGEWTAPPAPAALRWLRRALGGTRRLAREGWAA